MTVIYCWPQYTCHHERGFLLSILVKYWIPRTVGNFLKSWAFYRQTLLHEVEQLSNNAQELRTLTRFDFVSLERIYNWPIEWWRKVLRDCVNLREIFEIIWKARHVKRKVYSVQEKETSVTSWHVLHIKYETADLQAFHKDKQQPTSYWCDRWEFIFGWSQISSVNLPS